MTSGASARMVPARQPLRTAVALAVLTVVGMVMALFGLVMPFIGGDALAELLDAQELPADAQDLTTAIIVLAVIAIALLVLGFGATLASFILSILVVVRGEGSLRIGAAVLLAVTLLGYVLSFSLTTGGTAFPGAGSEAIDVLAFVELLVGVARILAMLVGLVFLMRGIGEVRRARDRAV